MHPTRPRTFEDMMAPFADEVRMTAEWLRRLIRESFPVLEEGIHGGAKVAMALYGVGGQDRIALGLQPGPRFVKLFIHDPEHLPETSLRLEGRGKHMRHVKLAAPAEAEREDLVRLMRVPVERRS